MADAFESAWDSNSSSFDAAWDDFDKAWETSTGGKGGIIGADDPKTPQYDGAVIKAAEPEGWFTSAFRNVFGGDESDVYKNEKGEYVQDWYNPESKNIETIPEFESQSRARTTAQGMGVLTSMVPGVGLSKLPAATSLLGRVLKNYALPAAASSATGIGADKISQARGDLPETSGGEDATRFALETGIGTAIPGGIDAVDTGLGKLSTLGKWLKDKLTETVIPEQTIPGFRERGHSLAGKPGQWRGSETVPETNIPEIRAEHSQWEPPPTFDDSITVAQRNKAMKARRSIDEDGRVRSGLEGAIARNRAIVDLPPEESATALLTRKDELLNEIDELVSGAGTVPPTRGERVVPGRDTGLLTAKGEPIVTNPGLENFTTFDIPTPQAEEFLSTIANPLEREKLLEEFYALKTSKLAEFDGGLQGVHQWRKSIGRQNGRVYMKGLGDNITNQEQLNKLLSDDLNSILRDQIDGYQALNGQLSDLMRIEPIVLNRVNKGRDLAQKLQTQPPESTVIQKAEFEPAHTKLGKWQEGTPARSKIGKWVPEKTIPEERIPGPWQANVEKLGRALGPWLSSPVGRGAAILGGGVSQVAGKTAGLGGSIAGGLQQAVSSPMARAVTSPGAIAGLAGATQMGQRGMMPGMAEAQAQDMLLPRDTERFNSDAMGAFLMKTASTPQAIIAQQLVSKLQKAFQAEDMDTVEKIHSDMARLFPDVFEPGLGVNGKLFYPDEQMKYMDNLRQLNRMGKVDSIHLAKQQNAFNNPQDARMLPIKPAPNNGGTGRPKFYEGTRVYDY